MDATDQPAPTNPGAEELLPAFPDFELHYDFDSRYSVMHFLDSIVEDLSTYSSVHSWDEKLINDEVKDMAKSAKQGLIRLFLHTASYVLTYSAVNEVSTLNGITRRHHAPERYLPEINVGPSKRWRAPCPNCYHLQEIKTTLAAPRHISSTKTPRSAYGRIVYV